MHDIQVYLQRFWEKVRVSDTLFYNGTPCLLWTGGGTTDGYGQMHFGKIKMMAHRFIWEATMGTLPEDKELDHLCKRRRCMNTGHLEPVSHDENLKRSEALSTLNAQKTHCLRGHEFTPENTRLPPGGGRKCRACEAIRRPRYKK